MNELILTLVHRLWLLNLPRSGLVQHPVTEDGSGGCLSLQYLLPASDLGRWTFALHLAVANHPLLQGVM
jgi:hypothetical protein